MWQPLDTGFGREKNLLPPRPERPKGAYHLSLIRVRKLYRVRYIVREPTPLDAELENPVATITRIAEAYTSAEAWEAARVELQITVQEARHLTPQGVPTLSVEEM